MQPADPLRPDSGAQAGEDSDANPSNDPLASSEPVIQPPAAGEIYDVAGGEATSGGNAWERERLMRELAAAAAPESPATPAPNDRQFTLLGILGLMAGAAMALAILRAATKSIAPHELALMSGGLAVLGIAVFGFFRPWFIVRAAWWVLVAVYVLASAVAMMRG